MVNATQIDIPQKLSLKICQQMSIQDHLTVLNGVMLL